MNEESRVVGSRVKFGSWVAILLFLFLFMFTPKASAANWVNTGQPPNFNSYYGEVMGLTTGTNGYIWASTSSGYYEDSGYVDYWNGSTWTSTGQPVDSNNVQALTTGTNGYIGLQLRILMPVVAVCMPI